MTKNELLLKSLGEIIFRVRKGKKLTQEDLGKLTSTSQMTIKRLESATVGTRLDNLVAVADSLGLKLADLFREAEGSDAKPLESPDSKWGEVVAKIGLLTSTEREWVASVIDEILKSPWDKKH